jgi:hypothetical protein
MDKFSRKILAVEQTKTRHQAVFLERLAQAKARLLAAIEGLEPNVMKTQPVTGEWTIKDIFGHLVCWNEEFRADIQMILQGLHPGYERYISGEDDFDRWNQDWIAAKSSMSWERIFDDFERDYQTAVQLILRLEPADFRKRGVTPWKRAAWERPDVLAVADTETVETLITYHWRHMNQHARLIERWRRRVRT